MEIVPKVQFPTEYDEIFYPGRLYMPWVGAAVLLLLGGLALLPVVAAVTGSRSPAATQGGLAFACAGLACWLGLVCMILNYLRSAMALTAEGFYHRDWRNRVWLIAWDDVVEVSVRRSSARRGGGYTDSIFLTYGALPGHARDSLELASESHMLFVSGPPVMDPGPIARAVIARLRLELAETSPDEQASRYEQAWVRPRETLGQPAMPASPGAGSADLPYASPSLATECKWCGETFPAGAAKCPQCGRPVSVE